MYVVLGDFRGFAFPADAIKISDHVANLSTIVFMHRAHVVVGP